MQQFSMAEVPDPPEGSWIGITKADGGWPQLVLSVSLNFPGRWATVLYQSAVLIAVPVCGVIFFKNVLLQNPGWPMMVFCVLMLVASEQAGRAVLRILRGLIRGEEPESLTLGENELQFDPGTLDRHAGQSKRMWDLYKYQRRPPVRTLRRGTFELDLRRIDGRQALLVVSGDEQIELGRFVREPEREWLFGVLRAWMGEHVTTESQSVVNGPLDSEPVRDESTHLECRREGWEGLSFVLRSPDWDRERVKMVFIFGFVLCGWTALGLLSVHLLLQPARAIETLCLTGWLGVWLAFEYLLGRTVESLLRPRESLVLTNEVLAHDRGCYWYFYETLNEALWKLWWRERVSVRRDAMQRVRLESIGPRDRLTFDVGAERVEVGRFLANADRRRLAQVLEDYVERGLDEARPEDIVMQSVAS